MPIWRRPVEQRQLRGADQAGTGLPSEPSVKFGQLPIGAGFRFGDRCYRKVSPLEAVEDTTGARRLMHRSAKVDLDEGKKDAEATQPLRVTLPFEAVESALHGCTLRVEQHADSLLPALSDDQLIAVLTLMREVHADAIARLRLGIVSDQDQQAYETSDPNPPLGPDSLKKGAENP